jgi:hypothetical protein
MIRILFWIFVALFLAAFFWGASASQQWPDAKRMLFWTIIEDIVITAMAGGLSYFLFLCWKKRKVVIAGKYGGGKVFLRDEEPVYYWSVMSAYGLATILLIFCLIASVLQPFGIDITSLGRIGIVLFFADVGFNCLVFSIGALQKGVVIFQNYDRESNPFAYWFYIFFLLLLGVFFITFPFWAIH